MENARRMMRSILLRTGERGFTFIEIMVVVAILAILAALSVYAGVKIPYISGHGFATLGISYLLLLAGNLFKGL